jgi:hypothetical protein
VVGCGEEVEEVGCAAAQPAQATVTNPAVKSLLTRTPRSMPSARRSRGSS